MCPRYLKVDIECGLELSVTGMSVWATLKEWWAVQCVWEEGGGGPASSHFPWPPEVCWGFLWNPWLPGKGHEGQWKRVGPGDAVWLLDQPLEVQFREVVADVLKKGTCPLGDVCIYLSKGKLVEFHRQFHVTHISTQLRETLIFSSSPNQKTS